MKKLITYFPLIMLIVYMISPIAVGLALIFGLYIELRGIVLFTAIIFFLSVITAVPLLFFKDLHFASWQRVLAVLLTPVSLLFHCSCLYLYFYSHYSGFAPLILTSLCFIISAIVMVHIGKSSALKFTLATISFILIIPVAFMTIMFSFFSSFVVRKTAQVTFSPNETYVAVKTYADSGALGGDILIDVFDNNFYFDTGFVLISNEPCRVYSGSYSSYVDVEWQGDTLIVNGDVCDLSSLNN